MTAIVLSFMAIMGFGSATIFARQGMATVGALPVTLLSLVVSFIASAMLAVVFAPGDFIGLPLLVWAWCIMIGAFNFLGGRNLSYLAVGRIGAARAAAIVGTAAVFASGLAIAFTGERPHWVVLVGTVVVVAGLATALSRNIMESSEGGGAVSRAALLGYAMAFGAAACYGSTSVVVKQLTIDFTSPLVVSTISLFFGILLVAPVAGKQMASAIRQPRQSRRFLAFAALSGLAAATGVNCTYLALQRADVVVVAPIVSANPLFTLLLAAIFLSAQENVNRWLVAGTAVTMGGVALVVMGSTL